MTSMFSSLKYYNYRVWFATALVANTGGWMQRIAQDWLVLSVLTHNSGTAVGIVMAFQFGPAIIFSPWAGLLADRLPRRAMLMVTQSLSGLLALGLGALILGGHIQLWHVYVFAGLLGVVSAFDSPVRATFVGQLVPRRMLSNAVGLNGASFNTARLIGPAVAGGLIAVIGIGWIFILNGVLFGFTLAGLALIRTRELHAMETVPRAKGQFMEGVRYIRKRTDIMVILIVLGVVSGFGMNFAVTSAMMAKVAFDKGPGEYGLLGSAMAIGSLVGALLAARRERPRVRLVIGSAFAFGILSGLLAVMPTYASFALMCIPVGLSSITLTNAANSTLQMTVEPEMRGRVMSFYMVVWMGATPIGAPLVGWICEVLGPRWGIGVGAIASLIVAVGVSWWAIRNWKLRVSYRVAARPHLMVQYPAADTSGEGSRTVGPRADTVALTSSAPVSDDAAPGQVAEVAKDRVSVGQAGEVSDAVPTSSVVGDSVAVGEVAVVRDAAGEPTDAVEPVPQVPEPADTSEPAAAAGAEKAAADAVDAAGSHGSPGADVMNQMRKLPRAMSRVASGVRPKVKQLRRHSGTRRRTRRKRARR